MENALREILAKINENPRYYPAPSNIVADEIIREIRRRIMKEIFQHKDKTRFPDMFDNLLSPILSPKYTRGVLSAYYYLTHDLGLDKNNAVNLIVKALEVLTALKPFESLSPLERALIDYLTEIIEGETRYSFYPLSVLDYACELGLIYWDGEKWNITEMGKFMLKLPPYEFVKALLTLETVLSRGSTNCMTYDFIETLKDILSCNNIHRLDFIVKRARVNFALAYSWLNRLASLGVIRLDHRSKVVKANPHTMCLLESIVNRDSNIYFTLIQSIISRSDPPLITTNISAYLKNMEDDPLIAECWNEIKQASTAIERGSYHAALRTLLPVIERVLREICIKERIAGTDKGLKALIEIVKGHKLISERVENLVKALGRDVELHGLEVLDIDRARVYAELALMAVLELLRDYRRHKILHRALRRISRDLNIAFEKLIEAYPSNRKVVHVQFISDNKMRITIKGKHVYEVSLSPNGEIEITQLISSTDPT